MSLNLKEFVTKQTKLVTKKSTTRVSKLDLTNKNIRGDIKLHIVPDSNDLYMLTSKAVYEVHQTETYEYQDETRTRYPTYIIPSSFNYNNVEGAVMPTEMQMKKLDHLTTLLDEYSKLTNKFQEGGAKLDSKTTETQLWTKYSGTYTKFWAKVLDIKPTTPKIDGKLPDTSKLIMCSHSSKAFVTAFNKWATPDVESELSVDEQFEKIQAAVSKDVGDARCVKISTVKADVGYDVEFKNLKLDSSTINITEEDITEAVPLVQEDWDYTNFDDEKVDTLIARLEKYLNDYHDSVEDESDDNSNTEDGNPFSDEE